MSKEYFWGDELSVSKKEIKWNPSLEDEDDMDHFDSDGIQHFLFLKQAVLGPKAEKERNVVEITTDNFDGDQVKQPLFSLKLDLNESSPLDIGVQPPVTLTLVEGSGPVCISGQHMIEINDTDEEFDDDEDEEEEEDALDVKASPDLPKSKKRPLSTSGNVSKKTKMAKLDKDAGKDEEEEEDAEMAEVDDDDDDEDEEDSDEDEEEEDSDDEDEEDDEEDDEDEEEEEEESPEKPVQKPKGKKGHMNGTATAKGDSKTKTKAAKKTEKAKGKKKALNYDEIKQTLKESSNVPKKEEKFKNFVRSSFHVSESKKLQDLWSWYRASLQK